MSMFDFSNEMFNMYIEVAVTGISAGFTLGFISWAIGFAIYGIIRFFKQA